MHLVLPIVASGVLLAAAGCQKVHVSGCSLYAALHETPTVASQSDTVMVSATLFTIPRGAESSKELDRFREVLALRPHQQAAGALEIEDTREPMKLFEHLATNGEIRRYFSPQILVPMGSPGRISIDDEGDPPRSSFSLECMASQGSEPTSTRVDLRISFDAADPPERPALRGGFEGHCELSRELGAICLRARSEQPDPAIEGPFVWLTIHTIPNGREDVGEE